MVNPKKTQIVQKLTDKLKKAKSLILTDYSGLSVPQQQELRSKVQEAGGEFRVTKNTLLKRALQPEARYQKLEASLRGPTATLFAFEDEIAPIKVLVEFAEEFELPKIKIGFFEGKIIEKEVILELAKIPTKAELLSKLVYLVNSPISGLANVLTSDMRKLVLVIANAREGGED